MSSRGTKPQNGGGTKSRPANRQQPAASEPKEPKEPKEAHACFAFFAALNVVCWLILRTLGTGQVTVGPLLMTFVGVAATGVLIGSGIGAAIASEHIWPRTYCMRLLASLLGFGIAVCPAMIGDSWNNGYHRFAFTMAGAYIGFAIESYTKLLSVVTKLVAHIGDNPDNAKDARE